MNTPNNKVILTKDIKSIKLLAEQMSTLIQIKEIDHPIPANKDKIRKTSGRNYN